MTPLGSVEREANSPNFLRPKRPFCSQLPARLPSWTYFGRIKKGERPIFQAAEPGHPANLLLDSGIKHA
jgi:hypothetical protein